MRTSEGGRCECGGNAVESVDAGGAGGRCGGVSDAAGRALPPSAGLLCAPRRRGRGCGENEAATFPENEKAIAEGNQDLLKFIEHIKEKRKIHYENFVRFWDENKGKDAFEKLRKNASAGFDAAGYRANAELANPYVKIAVMADIHANLNALEAVVQDAERRGITVFLNAGDIIGFGACPNEVIQMLYSKNALSVIGSYDLEVLDKSKKEKGSKKFALEFTRNALAKANETYLHALPIKLELEIAHKKLLMVNGTPDSDEHLHHDTSEEKFLEYSKNLWSRPNRLWSFTRTIHKESWRRPIH